jgi:hypothetical protein
MLKKYKDQLNQMYDQHPKLKCKLISMINHLRNPEQFKAAWAEMCDEFGLHDRVTMHALYNGRRMWIAAYFKEVFCGTIQSTQRSERKLNGERRTPRQLKVSARVCKMLLECLGSHS